MQRKFLQHPCTWCRKSFYSVSSIHVNQSEMKTSFVASGQNATWNSCSWNSNIFSSRLQKAQGKKWSSDMDTRIQPLSTPSRVTVEAEQSTGCSVAPASSHLPPKPPYPGDRLTVVASTATLITHAAAAPSQMKAQILGNDINIAEALSYLVIVSDVVVTLLLNKKKKSKVLLSFTSPKDGKGLLSTCSISRHFTGLDTMCSSICSFPRPLFSLAKVTASIKLGNLQRSADGGEACHVNLTLKICEKEIKPSTPINVQQSAEAPSKSLFCFTC